MAKVTGRIQVTGVGDGDLHVVEFRDDGFVVRSDYAESHGGVWWNGPDGKAVRAERIGPGRYFIPALEREAEDPR